MENFKHLPEPFRIRVIEPVKRTTRAYREEAIIKSGMNPFLLDSEDVFIDLLTDSGTGAVTQSMQAAMMRGDEAYSGSRSYYALAESVKNIFGYQYTIPTHQGRGAEQIYIPVLIKKREQEKGLDRSKMVAFSNYFFDTTQGIKDQVKSGSKHLINSMPMEFLENIRDNKTFRIPSDIQTGANLGMITLDTHLMSLVNRELIEPDEALEKSQEPVVMREKLTTMGFKLREM